MRDPKQESGVAFVTGAGGFLGSAVAAGLAGAGWRVAGFGRAPRIVGGPLPETFVEGDIAHADLVRAAERLGAPQLVFHAAGGASVGASLADPDGDRDRTVGSLREVLDFLREAAPDARLIYPSSAAVYGDAASGPISEDAPLRPVSPYGRNKLEAEQLIMDEHAARGLDTAIVRFFSAYGPGLRKQLLWDLAGRLASAPAAIELGGTGDEARDFLFVDDAVALVTLLARRDRAASPLILNGGAGQPVSVRQIADLLRDALGSRAEIRFSGQGRPGDPRSLVADVSAAGDLGFQPRTSLSEGVARYARWLMSERAPSNL